MKEIAERSLIDRLREFLETEARSGGGTVAVDEIATGLKELRKNGFMMG